MRDYLPITKEDMKKRGWDEVDFVYVSGDAYVDHPSFGHAIISRMLEFNGFRVGIIAQPDWKDDQSIQVFGKPRLGFLVSAGNVDSMVNHYSVSKKRRDRDFYTPGALAGKRPDYATIVYCNLIRKVYKKVPIIIGGIEASLRRLAHYDYWSNSLKHSILIDSQADIISYGMGEKSILAIAEALDSGIPIHEVTFIEGTVYKTNIRESIYDAIELPSYAELKKDKINYAKSFQIQYVNTDPFSAKRLMEQYEDFYIVQNPPQKPLTTSEMDAIYHLPYMRNYHPSYEEAGGVDAIKEVKFSLTHNRGCFGGCSFCALTFHQGRMIQSRSHESLLQEATMLTYEADFKGYIHDVGGPTANFRHVACEKQKTKGVCQNKQCLFPKPCKNLDTDHSDYLALLRKLRNIPKVKKVFIRSGIRFDYLLEDKDQNRTFFKELCEHHISGQLKVAPEHVADGVLCHMGKPENSVYQEFASIFKTYNDKAGKNQFLVPYLMSSHPGSTLKDAITLALYLKDLGYMPEQVQDFYPTPSTISTVMYYTEVDPRSLKPVYVAKKPRDKAMQRALIQYRNPKNYELVTEALTIAGRRDLIGFGKECLIRPRVMRSEKEAYKGKKPSSAKSGTRNQKSGVKQKAKKPTIRNRKPKPNK